jgi:hypothetical protein
MVLGFGQAKDDDVAALIARKQYARAIEVIKEQLQGQRNDPRVRMQLADVLALAGRPREATAILRVLADEFAHDGFAAKAVAVLKKIQKIDPSQGEVVERLATLIEQRQRQAGPSLPRVLETRAPAARAEAEAEQGLELEIGFGAAPISAPVAAAPVSADPLPAEPLPAEPLVIMELEEPSAAPAAPAAILVNPAPVEDHDLILEEATFAEPEEDELVVALEVDPGAIVVEPPPEEPSDPRADADFAQELMAVIEEAFPSGLNAAAATAPAPAAAPTAAPSAPARIVVSPLFQDFAVDEMVAVIQGLRLLTFERGGVILRQGDPGESLYMLASGRARAFVKAADGRQVAVGDLGEGSFFGEISIVTGKPRTATVVAASRCELLELDRATLDGITRDHPHVWDVLRDFAERRARRA